MLSHQILLFCSSWLGGSVIPGSGDGAKEPLDKRARGPFWHGQGEPTLNQLQGPA